MITRIFRRFGLALIVLGLWLPAPDLVAAEKFFIRFGLGLNSQSRIQDVLSTPIKFDPYVTVGGDLTTHLGLNYYLEGIYKFNPWVGGAIGFGFLSHTMIGTESPYTFRIFNQPDKILNVTPKLIFDASYIYIAAVFALPVTPSLSINAAGGAGYYFVDYSSESHWYPFFRYLGENQYTLNFQGDHRAAGYHIKMGLDYKLFELMTFTAEVLYRGVELNMDSVPLDTRPGSTVQFLEWLEQEDLAAFHYDISQFQLPRVSVFMGIMFRF